MTRKETKKSLALSALSLLMCVVMLAGLTFAWFTDSVTNKGNRIQAGNLKIDLLMDKDGIGNEEYVSIADGNGDIFSAKGNGIKWEPGKTEIVYLAVKNKGNLAINYNILLNVKDGGLANALEYAVLDGKKATDLEGISSWTELKAMVGAQTGDVKPGEVTAAPNGTLDEIINGVEGETQYFALAVHMKESAGNEYAKKSITIDVNVVAKQAMAENDSFDNTYDEGATFPVGSQSEFEEALENAQPGDKLELSKGTFAISGGNYEVTKGVSIIGQEGTVIALDNKKPTDVSTAGMVLGDNATLANVEITGKSMGSSDYNSFIRIKGNNVVLDNIKINASTTVASPIRIDSTGADNVITIKNSDLFSYGGRAIYIVDGANGTVNIENTKAEGIYPISVNSASSQDLILNVKDSRLEGWTSYGNIKSASFTNTEFGKCLRGYEFIRPQADTTFTNCTFEKTFKVGAGTTGKTFNFNKCVSNDITITTSNIQAQLLDMTDSDGTNLRGCDIFVDGVKATLS